MAHIVIVGAGLSGAIMAYELKAQLRREDRITVVTRDPIYHFVPSNPWVAVGWRTREAVQVDLAPTLARQGIGFKPVPVERIEPGANQVGLADGSVLDYDYLVIATGPDLAFDEIEGLGPHGGFTASICHVDHALEASKSFDAFCRDPGPIVVGAVQGASCFGPAYEFAFILDAELRRRKIRDRVPMTFVTSEPYIGHLGLDGVGDTKGLLEGQMRQHHIKWLTSSRVKKVEPGRMTVEEIADNGAVKETHELPFGFSMMLPAFRGIAPLRGLDGLVNPRGFVLVDKHQQNAAYKNVFAVGVCVAIPPVGSTPVPCGVPKTGFMIESMVTATALNLGQILRGQAPTHQGTWNAVCLADFGDSGVAFVAQPQIPPRNVNWSASGKWVHVAKIGFEKYFIHKMRRGTSEPFYEAAAMKMLGIAKLKKVFTDNDGGPANGKQGSGLVQAAATSEDSMTAITADTRAGAQGRRVDWSPYLAGAALGVLSWIAFGVMKDPLGVTTAYSRIASLFAKPVIGAEAVAANSYWKAMPLSMDYGVWFLIGIPLGAFLTAILSGTFRLELVPEVWRHQFGGSVAKRFIAAFLGGIIIMFGARLAGGCTSGHGISGGLQLAVSSWVFLGVMFATGLAASAVLFNKR